MALTQTQVSQLYTALMGRASEGNGSVYWMTHGTDMTSAAESMLNSAAVAAYFGDALDSDFGFVTTLYANTLNKTVNGADGTIEDLAGITYWTNVLESGEMTRAEMMVSFIDRVVEIQNTAPTTASQQFTNRVEVSNYAADNIAAAPADYAVSLAFQNAGSPTGLVVTDDVATITTAEAAVVASTVVAGTTFNLTTDAEIKNGTVGNDTFNGSDETLILDTLNGSEGIDTLNYNDMTGGENLNTMGLTLNSIETINVRSVGAVDVNTSTFTGVATVNVLVSTDVTEVTAAATTDVNVTGATDAISVFGAKNVTITDATVDTDIIVGDTDAYAAGTITVTDTKQGAGTIIVDGGTNVTVTATSTDTGAITIGANEASSGTVTVTQNLNSDATDNLTGGAISVTGGTTVDVTVNVAVEATESAADLSTQTTGDIEVIGNDDTTTVTVTQNASVTEFTSEATALVKGTTAVTFLAMAKDDTLEVNGLTFTASKALTAAEVAAAFANLTDADTQSATGVTENGFYTGEFADATSGSASGATVVFTGSDENAPAMTIEYSDVDADPTTPVKTAGTAEVEAETTENEVVFGAVDISGEAITTATVDGFVELNVDSDALTDLSIANGTGDITVATTETTLDMTVNAIDGDVTITAVETLNITTATAASDIALTAAALTDLTVAGTVALNLASSAIEAIAALETLTVTGTAGVTLAGHNTAVLTSIDTTGTTGAVTATINGAVASYAGGAGVDTVTLATTNAVTEDIDLGAGNDKLTLVADNTAVPTVAVVGGTGTDTVSMTIASAVTYSLATAFAAKVTGFERLVISNAAGTNDDAANEVVTVDVEKLGFSYVTTTGTVADATPADSDSLLLSNMANNGTVVLKAAGLVTVAVKDADEGETDALNVIAQSENTTDLGVITAEDIETINITATDLNTDLNADAEISLALVADATTVNISGDADLELDMTDATSVTLINATSMTGALTVISTNEDAAVTIKGGSGNDDITSAAASTKADMLYGYAGDDSFTANAGLSKLYGGDGADTFNISVASLNVNSAATIMDIESGDVIVFDTATAFVSAQIELDVDGNPTLTDYADAAINALADTEMGWFQYNSNTYIVMDNGGNDTFTDGTDFIVKIAGLVDLDTEASYNDSNILEIA